MSRYKRKSSKTRARTLEINGDLFEEGLLEEYWAMISKKLTPAQIIECKRVRNRLAFQTYCEDHDIPILMLAVLESDCEVTVQAREC